MRTARAGVFVVTVVAAGLVPVVVLATGPASASSTASGVAVASMSQQIDFCSGQRYCEPSGPVSQGPLTFVGDVPAGAVTADQLTVASWSATMSGALATIPTVSFTGTGTGFESLAGTCSGVLAVNGYTVAGVGLPAPAPEFGEQLDCTGTAGTAGVSFELDMAGVQLGSEFVATAVNQPAGAPPPVPLGTGTASGTTGPYATAFTLEGTMPFLPAGTVAESYVTCPNSSSTCDFGTYPTVGLGSLGDTQGTCSTTTATVPPVAYDLACTSTAGPAAGDSFTLVIVAASPAGLGVPDGAYLAA